MASYSSYDDWASQNIIEYAAGKGFDTMGGSGGGMWGSCLYLDRCKDANLATKRKDMTTWSWEL